MARPELQILEQLASRPQPRRRSILRIAICLHSQRPFAPPVLPNRHTSEHPTTISNPSSRPACGRLRYSRAHRTLSWSRAYAIDWVRSRGRLSSRSSATARPACRYVSLVALRRAGQSANRRRDVCPRSRRLHRAERQQQVRTSSPLGITSLTAQNQRQCHGATDHDLGLQRWLNEVNNWLVTCTDWSAGYT